MFYPTRFFPFGLMIILCYETLITEISFVSFILFFNFNVYFWPHYTACGILVPRPGIEPMPPVVGSRSLNRWTSGEVSVLWALILSQALLLALCPLPWRDGNVLHAARPTLYQPKVSISMAETSQAGVHEMGRDDSQILQRPKIPSSHQRKVTLISV